MYIIGLEYNTVRMPSWGPRKNSRWTVARAGYGVRKTKKDSLESMYNVIRDTYPNVVCDRRKEISK